MINHYVHGTELTMSRVLTEVQNPLRTYCYCPYIIDNTNIKY